jgi:hypothetical protein
MLSRRKRVSMPIQLASRNGKRTDVPRSPVVSFFYAFHYVAGQALRGCRIKGPHRSCEFFDCRWNSAQYVVAEMLRGYHRNGPHSGPYEKFTA